MGKFLDIETDVFSLFATRAWLSESIATYPSNYISDASGDEFIRVSIIPGSVGVDINSVSGQLIIDIFISAGEGPSRASFIADKLETYLRGKTFRDSGFGTTQFEAGALSGGQVDPDNSTLYMLTYSISFNYFGV